LAEVLVSLRCKEKYDQGRLDIHRFIQEKKLFLLISHEIFAQMLDQKGNVGWFSILVLCWKRDFVISLIGKKQF